MNITIVYDLNIYDEFKLKIKLISLNRKNWIFQQTKVVSADVLKPSQFVFTQNKNGVNILKRKIPKWIV